MAVALTYPLDYNSPDAVQILEHLEQFKEQYQTDPQVRQFAVWLLDQAGVTGDNDVENQVAALFCWVKANVVYTADPNGVEFVISPKNLIAAIQAQGYARGDCDDHCLLFATLLGALGITSEFVAVKLTGPEWDHVIVSVQISGQWIDLDPCNKNLQDVVSFPERLVLS